MNENLYSNKNMRVHSAIFTMSDEYETAGKVVLIITTANFCPELWSKQTHCALQHSPASLTLSETNSSK